jgi:uncharacterized membrane protein YdjX (TVP38/TMEM64 family)
VGVKGWLKLLGFAALMLACLFGLRAIGIDVFAIRPERVRVFVLSFGVWAPLIYLLVYSQPIVPFPVSILTLAGGLAFGPVWGTLAAVTGATTRACGQFGLAHVLGRHTIAKLFRGRVAALNNKIGANSFQAVLWIRLIPNVPFDMQNYGLGFSKVRFGPFALATVVGLLPGCFVFVYLGYSLTDPNQVWKFLLAILLLACLPLLTKLWTQRHPPRSVPA